MQIKVLGGSSPQELNNRHTLVQLLANSPIPPQEICQNMGVYINRQNLSRILFMNELYQKIVNIHGVIIEFGVRWGQNMSTFQNLRGIYEPFNYTRKIIGFDTFSGFPSVTEKDGNKVDVGNYAVTEGYMKHLEEVLQYHETESPIQHKKKFELVKGDATVTFEKYLKDNPHLMVAMTYFDFDLYEPTKKCLELLLKRVTKGSIIAFDELNCPEFPGETVAVMETIGLDKYSIRRSPLNPLISYLIIE